MQRILSTLTWFYHQVLALISAAKSEAVQVANSYADTQSEGAYDRSVEYIESRANGIRNEAIQGAGVEADGKIGIAEMRILGEASGMAIGAEGRAVAAAAQDATAKVGAASTTLQSFATNAANTAETNAGIYTDIKRNELYQYVQNLTALQASDVSHAIISESGTMDMANLKTKLLGRTATAQGGTFSDNKGNYVDINLGAGQSLTISDFPTQAGGTESITLNNGDVLFLQLVNGAVTVAIAQKDGVIARVVSLEGRMQTIEGAFADRNTFVDNQFTTVNSQIADLTEQMRLFQQHVRNDQATRGNTIQTEAWAQ